MQALAERIHERLAGALFVRADPLSFSALKTVTPSPEALVGKQLGSVGRRGKFLVFDLDDLRLLAHLSQGGRVTFEPATATSKPKGGVVRLRFDRDPALLLKEREC